MGRYGWFAGCVLVFAALPAFARTWNYDQGQTVEGDFVRVTKARVVINVAGKMMQIPFGHLSEDDQDFVRHELEAHGLGSQLPPKKKTAASSTTDESKIAEQQPVAKEAAKLGPDRTWTDVMGRTVRARFVGMDNAKVVLQVKGKSSSFPFDKFSIADQQYVRAEMNSRGEGDRVPAEAPPMNVQPEPTAPQMAQAGPPAMQRGGPMNIPRPSFPAMPRMPEIRFPRFTPAAPVQPPEQANSIPAPMPAPVPMPAPASPQFQPPVVNTYVPTPPPTMPSSEQTNAQVMVKKCGSCGRVVPNNLTAGDKCPYCGTYFDYDETTGKTAHWVYFATPSGIGAVVGLVIYALRRRQSA